jgi:hypothetical protein
MLNIVRVEGRAVKSKAKRPPQCAKVYFFRRELHFSGR